MFIIQSKNLVARGVLNDQSAALEFRKKWFRPGPAFNKSLRQTAIEFCEDALSQGRQYMLIEFPLYFMAWRRFCPNNETQAQLRNSSSSTVHPQMSPIVSQVTPAFVNPSYQDEKISQSVLDETVKTQTILGPSIDDVLIQQCKSELAFHIGPMADYITEKTLTKSAQLSPEQLISTLATYIPNTKAGLLFKWTLAKKVGS